MFCFVSIKKSTYCQLFTSFRISNWMFVDVIASTKKYLQSDWLRGVQYWVLGKLPPRKFPPEWLPPDNFHPENPHQRKFPPRITPTWKILTRKIPTQDNSHLENSQLEKSHPGQLPPGKLPPRKFPPGLLNPKQYSTEAILCNQYCLWTVF